MSPLHSALSGLLTGLGLIVAIGAQNAFVLRQGLVRRYVGVVVAICALSDAVLILAGVAGVGALITAHPTIVTVARWGGAIFLVQFGIRSALAARHPGAMTPEERGVTSLRAAVATTVAFTWLNPHVYLDTVVMLGSLSATHGRDGRWWFGLGATCGSLLWFTALGYGARWLRPVFARPRAWQVLDLVIAVVMITLGVSLVVGA
ncbi:LysE/ArgO family amino acid transporter [Arsenicicoccus sp. oral taxon 190]|uniref:LysE/ArgO family amino acid transporter n=1 Tax=Arsenicicoccus sp. oral taxon 190 TaxID=1658671 RepID=UPI00067A1F11|nr:LysE/ArgO family amino acid transporter [Arsenicicoccus sp. oral taxon 190]AKT52547.1 amino acid transporter [Arsenicicoccus sp. oral taxon 190]